MTRARAISRFALAGCLLAVLALGCSSGRARPQSRLGKGFRTLEAVVVGRGHEAPGSGGGSFAGSGTWFLELEARDGEATAHYRFEVTRDQYNRFPEGTRVQLILADERLREIRPVF